MSPPLRDSDRDTDADWRRIGQCEPFWGVLTQPEYRQDNLNAERLAEFYATGIDEIGRLAREFEGLTDAPFKPWAALDFGCGVGRLTEAMTRYSDGVTGVDISPGMLAAARANSTGRAVYVKQLPEGPFGWVNSYIVFQHIPPKRGIKLLEQLLDRLAPEGYASLHFTIFRDAVHARQAKKLWHWTRNRVRSSPPTGAVMMYDYNLNQLTELFVRAGIGRMFIQHVDHGGHHGVFILGRKKK